MSRAEPRRPAAFDDAKRFCRLRQRQWLRHILKRHWPKADRHIPRCNLELAGRTEADERSLSSAGRRFELEGFDEVSVKPKDVVTYRIDPNPSFVRKMDAEESVFPCHRRRLQLRGQEVNEV